MKTNLLPNLIKVSNNSQLTAQIQKTLQEKLNDYELKNFEDWLKIVQNKINNQPSKFSVKKFMR